MYLIQCSFNSCFIWWVTITWQQLSRRAFTGESNASRKRKAGVVLNMHLAVTSSMVSMRCVIPRQSRCQFCRCLEAHSLGLGKERCASWLTKGRQKLVTHLLALYKKARSREEHHTKDFSPALLRGFFFVLVTMVKIWGGQKNSSVRLSLPMVCFVWEIAMIILFGVFIRYNEEADSHWTETRKEKNISSDLENDFYFRYPSKWTAPLCSIQ